MVMVGLILHALLFALIYALTEVPWYWAAVISGLAVWFGILIVDAGWFD